MLQTHICAVKMWQQVKTILYITTKVVIRCLSELEVLQPGLCPRPYWGNLQRFPDHLAAFRGGRKTGDGKGMGRKGRGKDRMGMGGLCSSKNPFKMSRSDESDCHLCSLHNQ